VNGIGVRRGGLSGGEKQVSRTDQRGRERLDVGVGGDAPEVALGGQVGRNHSCGFREERDAPGCGPAHAGDEHEAHRARGCAESFGSDPERYDRARPRYPEAMVQAILAATPGPDVLDVGCGTGISARQFQAAGCNVLGVDVDERMAEFAQGRGLEVEVAAFEAWDPAGRTFDAVVAGQTWHWVDPVAGAAHAARALRTGGWLALFWNVFDPSPEVAAAFAAVYRQVMPDWNPWARSALDAYSALFTKALDGIRVAGAFSEPARWRFDWERSYTRDEWLDQVSTGGDASQFSPAQLDELRDGIGAAIDAIGRTFTMPYAAVVITATRTCASGATRT
jgi:SAM-dependent methyltransferase